MFEMSAKFDGVKEALSRLEGIPKAVRKKAVAKAVNLASKELLSAAKSRVPKRLARELPGNIFYKGGQLKRSLGRKTKSCDGVAVGIVGARTNFRIEVGVTTRDGPKDAKNWHAAGTPIYVNPAKYLHLVELGTDHSPGTHFLRDAMQDKRQSIRDGMIAVIDEAIMDAAGGAAS